MDVDGVLTDGAFWWGPNGEELKRFTFLDIMGVSIARRAGIVFALISGENSPLIDRYATKMSIEDVHKGCRQKDIALRAFADKHAFDLSEVCFIGDDINDVPALELAGFPAVPATAHQSAIRVAKYVAKNAGGNGAVREILDLILEQNQEHNTAS